MRKIFPLSPHVISKIAAGEVIERPVYAVKELVENSLDAGADSIMVQIEESGLKRITVIDNGEGMSEEDIKECFKPHTTSKIATEEQLASIHTLGFRGEALASIAAISRVSIKSKTKHATVGTHIELVTGTIKNISPIGMPQGTNISVSNLFYPVPARKKFLKSNRTEFRHIVELMTQVSLAHPHVHFSLSHNGKILFAIPKETSVLERIKILLGKHIFSQLLPITYKDKYISLSGFLVKPQITTKISNKQYLYINKRPVTDKTIAQAVKDAYGTLLEARSYPIFLLFCTMPPETIDANVHPRKEQVRFIDTQMIYDAVHKAIAETLANNNLLFFHDNEMGIGLSDKALTKGHTLSFAGKLLKENQIPWDVRPLREIIDFSEISQMHNLYLISATKQGILFVDQHAAHERILYEQFLENFKKQKKIQPQFQLQKPIFLDLSFSDRELLQEHIMLLKKFGFTFEHFKHNTFLIHAVPLLFQDRNIPELIAEILADLMQEKRIKEIDAITHRMLSFLACRAAVKQGERVTKKQAKDLLEKLENTSNNTTCPHGRPTKVILSLQKIHGMFKRR